MVVGIWVGARGTMECVSFAIYNECSNYQGS